MLLREAADRDSNPRASTKTQAPTYVGACVICVWGRGGECLRRSGVSPQSALVWRVSVAVVESRGYVQ